MGGHVGGFGGHMGGFGVGHMGSTEGAGHMGVEGPAGHVAPPGHLGVEGVQGAFGKPAAPASGRNNTEGKAVSTPTPAPASGRNNTEGSAMSSPTPSGRNNTEGHVTTTTMSKTSAGRNQTEGLNSTEGHKTPPKHPHLPPVIMDIPPTQHGCGMLRNPFQPCVPEVGPPLVLTPPPHDTPTGVFTGLHTGNIASMQEKYREHYNIQRAGNQENLSAPSIGLNHVPVEKVGTGKEEHHYEAKHGDDMVPPRDPFHLGEWKHDIPGKTIIAGHVSFGSNPGPLYKLDHLGIHHGRPDQVTLQGADGTSTAYTYQHHEIVKDPKDQNTWNRIFAPGDPAHPQLVLVTCTGPLITKHDISREPALSGSQGLHKWRMVTYLDGTTHEKP